MSGKGGKGGISSGLGPSSGSGTRIGAGLADLVPVGELAPAVSRPGAAAPGAGAPSLTSGRPSGESGPRVVVGEPAFGELMAALPLAGVIAAGCGVGPVPVGRPGDETGPTVAEADGVGTSEFNGTGIAESADALRSGASLTVGANALSADGDGKSGTGIAASGDRFGPDSSVVAGVGGLPAGVAAAV
jgi:hypothetical protein